MDGVLGDQRLDATAATLTSNLTAVDAALATGDVAAALRAWHDTYDATTGNCRWEGFAEAGDAYLRIARALGSPASAVAQARDLYLSALLRASGTGSLDGVLRLASAFADLGDDESVTQSLRIARRLAGADPEPELRDRLDSLRDARLHPPQAVPPALGR